MLCKKLDMLCKIRQNMYCSVFSDALLLCANAFSVRMPSVMPSRTSSRDDTSSSSPSSASALSLFEPAPPCAALGLSGHSAVKGPFTVSISAEQEDIPTHDHQKLPTLSRASLPLPRFIACDLIRCVSPPTEKRTL